MFEYQRGAFEGSPAKAATFSRGAAISISTCTSTAIRFVYSQASSRYKPAGD